MRDDETSKCWLVLFDFIHENMNAEHFGAGSQMFEGIVEHYLMKAVIVLDELR